MSVKVTTRALVQPLFDAKDDVAKVTDCYDSVASIYHKVLHKDSWLAPETLAVAAGSLVEEKKRPSTQVLDFGAGSGSLGVEMKKLGFSNMDGIDVSKGMLDVAQNEFDAPVYRNAFVGSLGKDVVLKPESYDFVVSSGVIGTHVYTDHLPALMELVKPDGVLMYTIRIETDDSKEFQDFYSSLDNSVTEGSSWSQVKSEVAGALMVEMPTVKHRIVALKRTTG